MAARDDLNRASEHLDGAGEHTGDAAHHAKEALEAGASGTLERTKDAARETARKAEHVAGRVAHAEPNRSVEARVDSATEGVLHTAGNVVQGAAPIVGRGAEAAVNLTGAAVSAAGGLLGIILGKIAGRVGGWWSTAAQAVKELPEAERAACQVHFTSYEARPADLTFEQALPGYALGYVAAENPAYRGRQFEDVEPDLRHGFGADAATRYDHLRDFTRYGYERGIGRS